MLTYFLAYIAKIGAPGIYWYGAFIVFSVYAYTELMDKNRNAMYLEALKSALGLCFIWQAGGDWFGTNLYLGAWAVWVVGAWFVGSAAVAGWFGVRFGRETMQVSL